MSVIKNFRQLTDEVLQENIPDEAIFKNSFSLYQVLRSECKRLSRQGLLASYSNGKRFYKYDQKI